VVNEHAELKANDRPTLVGGVSVTIRPCGAHLQPPAAQGVDHTLVAEAELNLGQVALWLRMTMAKRVE
jgi:hypothetical protein